METQPTSGAGIVPVQNTDVTEYGGLEPVPNRPALPGQLHERSSLAPGGEDVTSAGEADAFEIEVVGPSGVPVPFAELFSRTGSTCFSLGKVDARGHLQFDAVPEGAELVAVHHDYVAKSHPMGMLAELHSVTFRMSAAGRIEGVVVNGDTGAPVGEGYMVYGRPDVLPVGRASDLMLASKDSPVVTSARTDSDGHFVLDGLDYRTVYRLVAAGPGAYSVESARRVAPGTSGVRLEVGSLLAIQVKLSAPGGSMASPSRWMGRQGSTVCFDIRGTHGSGLRRLEDEVALLAGYDSYAAPEDPLFLVYKPADAYEEKGHTLRFVGSFPGYAPIDVELTPRPLDQEFEPTRIELVSDSRAHGGLQIRVEGAPANLAHAPGSLLFGRLVLKRDDGDDLTIALNMDDLVSGPGITGIPTGKYRVHFVGHLGFYHGEVHSELEQKDDGLLEVREGWNRWSIDCHDAGALAVETLDRDGWVRTDYMGFLPEQRIARNGHVEYAVNGTVIGTEMQRGQIPWILLPTGSYRVTPLGRIISLDPPVNSGADGKPVRPIEVEIEPGQFVKLVWQDLPAS